MHILLTITFSIWILQVLMIWSMIGLDGKDLKSIFHLETFSQKICFILYWHIPLYPILKIMFNGFKDFVKDGYED